MVVSTAHAVEKEEGPDDRPFILFQDFSWRICPLEPYIQLATPP
jgi:hypothetical protein